MSVIAETNSRHAFAVCAYKESPFLEPCIESLLAQEMPGRILIATATDNARIRAAAEKYGIPLLDNPAGPGIAGDWNYALSCAEADFVTLAHQDDIYEPSYSREAVRALEAAARPLLFFSDYYEIRDGEKETDNRNLRVKRRLLAPLADEKKRGSVRARRRSLSLGNPICCPAVTYAVKNLPQPVFSEGMRSNLDWEAWEKISRLEGEFVYVPRMLMGHRIHEASTTTEIIGNRQRTREDLEMLKKFWPAPAAALINRLYRRAEKSNRQ